MSNMGVQRGSKIITDDMALCSDATVELRRAPQASKVLQNLLPITGRDASGSMTNNASFQVDGKGGYIDFDGTNDYVDFGDLDFVHTRDLTISFAARVDSGATSNDRAFVTKGSGSFTRPIYIFFDVAAGSTPSVGNGNSRCLTVCIRNTSNTDRIVISGPTDSIVGDEDFTIDVVIDVTNKTLLVYKNGELLMSDTNSNFAGIKNTGDPLRLGADADEAKDLNGRIYYFRIYERCLTAAEIKRNYNSVKGRFV